MGEQGEVKPYDKAEDRFPDPTPLEKCVYSSKLVKIYRPSRQVEYITTNMCQHLYTFEEFAQRLSTIVKPEVNLKQDPDDSNQS